MTKLFTALDLPSDVTASLAAIQPPPAPGIRLVPSEQMHVTLHFIGEMDTDRATRITNALDAVRCSPFALVIEGIGHFIASDGATTLWAGVRESAELRTLHEAIGRALAIAGIPLEQRRYTPHVSLARFRADVPVETVREFLERHHGLLLPAIPIRQFGLYSSVMHEGAPVYRRERAYTIQ